ncbi:MAG: outer membrane protein assembly factor BamD [Planctomycetes bacterium]|nr:outer membrane protein assembly factor BamD [Planctomycetota bacterium]
MARNKYWKAFGLYEKQIARFPMGKLLDRALAREAEIADAFLAGKKRWVLGIFRVSAEDDGMTIHERIAERVPGTKLASESIMNVADYLYGRRRWAEATQAYDRYREMFAGRYLTEQAELQATRAVYASFAGVAYDDTPLVEAEQRYKAFLTRYPHSDGAKEAAAALVEIEQAKARKDYETGRFYARTGRKIPAAFYYRQVVQLYPGTIWAEKSAAALSSLAPADPNQAQGGAVTNKVGAG